MLSRNFNRFCLIYKKITSIRGVNFLVCPCICVQSFQTLGTGQVEIIEIMSK